MGNELNTLTIKDTFANPAPLGLLGFGMTTVLLNIHNAGLYPLGAMILGMGLFYGGIAQIIAGIMEWKKNNTFGTTAFTSYGLFWLTLVALITLPELIPGIEAPNGTAMGMYFIMWGIFTSVMFIGTLKINLKLQIVFSTLSVLFFLLAIAKLTGNEVIGKIAGFEGIICGSSAIYAGLSQVIEELWKK